MAALGLLAVVGCHFEPVGEKPELDPGPPPGPRVDAGADQATPPPMDAGPDLAGPLPALDGGADLAPDAAPDLGADPARDGASDPPADLPGQPDVQPDRIPDVSPEAPLALIGEACSQHGACLSGVCSDGVCCATACGGVCLSCNLPGSVGLCMVAPAGQDPRMECSAQPPETCGRAGACDGNGACRRHPEGTTCGPGRTCAGGTCEGAAPGGPALWWRLDEAAGTVAADASGNGRHGSYAGGPGLPAPSTQAAPVSFANPGARAFAAGTRAMIRLAPVPPALKPTSNLSVSLWFRATSALMTGSDVINLGGDYFLRLKPDAIEWVKRASPMPTGFYAVCRVVGASHLDGRWHHLAGVTDAAGMRLYVDGVLVASNGRAEPILYTHDQLLVGREGNGGANHDFEGLVDEVRIYTRALAPAELAALAAGAQ